MFVPALEVLSDALAQLVEQPGSNVDLCFVQDLGSRSEDGGLDSEERGDGQLCK